MMQDYFAAYDFEDAGDKIVRWIVDFYVAANSLHKGTNPSKTQKERYQSNSNGKQKLRARYVHNVGY